MRRSTLQLATRSLLLQLVASLSVPPPCSSAAGRHASGGLRDTPLFGAGPPQYLDSPAQQWTARSGDVTIPATVPGDLISDLAAARMLAHEDVWSAAGRG